MIHRIHGSVLDTHASIVAHQVNCMGVMGSGVAAQIKKRYPSAYKAYKAYCDENAQYRYGLLGCAQICPVSFNPDGTPRIFVANLFGQYEYGRDRAYIYTIYSALRISLMKLADFAIAHDNIIAIPYKIGCDRGGGDWSGVVLPMIEKTLAGCKDVLICEIDGRKR